MISKKMWQALMFFIGFLLLRQKVPRQPSCKLKQWNLLEGKTRLLLVQRVQNNWRPECLFGQQLHFSHTDTHLMLIRDGLLDLAPFRLFLLCDNTTFDFTACGSFPSSSSAGDDVREAEQHKSSLSLQEEDSDCPRDSGCFIPSECSENKKDEDALIS